MHKRNLIFSAFIMLFLSTSNSFALTEVIEGTLIENLHFYSGELFEFGLVTEEGDYYGILNPEMIGNRKFLSQYSGLPIKLRGETIERAFSRSSSRDFQLFELTEYQIDTAIPSYLSNALGRAEIEQKKFFGRVELNYTDENKRFYPVALVTESKVYPLIGFEASQLEISDLFIANQKAQEMMRVITDQLSGQMVSVFGLIRNQVQRLVGGGRPDVHHPDELSFGPVSSKSDEITVTGFAVPGKTRVFEGIVRFKINGDRFNTAEFEIDRGFLPKVRVRMSQDFHRDFIDLDLNEKKVRVHAHIMVEEPTKPGEEPVQFLMGHFMEEIE